MALNTFWESRPRWGTRNKDRKFRAELTRIIQSSDSDTNDVISFKVLHVVDRGIDKQAATAISTKSTIYPSPTICNHFVALRFTAEQINCASRPTDNENLVSASEVLTVPTITEILTRRRGRKFVDNFAAPAPSRNRRIHVTRASELLVSRDLPHGFLSDRQGSLANLKSDIIGITAFGGGADINLAIPSHAV
jgi:hypothetical protein